MIKCKSPAWYTARIGKFTASNFGKIMSIPSNKNVVFSKTALNTIEKAAAQLYYNDYFEKGDNEASTWGQDNEVKALNEFCKRTGFRFEDAGFIQSAEIEDIGCTPDAYILDESTSEKLIAEVKCPFSSNNHKLYSRKISSKETLKEISPYYYWQTQGEMLVTGANNCYFISYDPRIKTDKNIHFVKIIKDEKAILFLQNKLKMAIEIRNKILKDFMVGVKMPKPLNKYW
ncbi:MAG: hypothetical protein A2033_00570 [Bacteroidetes bacterium GWA2_31_9]|nr:MAG: hypothetical protein A2033_00570 [Bacteroidetes bacterium GWA2_31_9]